MKFPWFSHTANQTTDDEPQRLHSMKLVQPTDFDILNALDQTGGRNVAANIARELGRDRSYVNTRFSKLVEYGLVRRVGPADRSGLYDLTVRGERALRYRDQYDQADDFESLISSGNMSPPDEGDSEQSH